MIKVFKQVPSPMQTKFRSINCGEFSMLPLYQYYLHAVNSQSTCSLLIFFWSSFWQYWTELKWSVIVWLCTIPFDPIFDCIQHIHESSEQALAILFWFWSSLGRTWAHKAPARKKTCNCYLSLEFSVEIIQNWFSIIIFKSLFTKCKQLSKH